ncbi:carbohydrate sulfotransferase 11-like [Oculina patagonica]
MRFRHLLFGRKSLRLLATIAWLFSLIFMVAWITQTGTNGHHRQGEEKMIRDEFGGEQSFKHNFRTKQMQEYCSKHVNDSNVEHVDLSNIIVLEKHKLVFCPVPKVSCSVWKRLLVNLEGVNIEKDVHQEIKNKLTSLQQFSLKDRRNILKTYTKFMFVRNPFERLLSAYKDVFLGRFKRSNNFWQGYRRRVREYLVQNGRLGIDPNVDNTTFEEFATYVVLTKRNGEKLQVHWREMTSLCHPCYIQFDYIGHYETLSEDAQFIFRKTNLQDKVQFPQWRPSDTHFLMQKYYSNLTLLRIAQLQNIYKEDMELFGYAFPGLLQPVIDKLIDHKL